MDILEKLKKENQKKFNGKTYKEHFDEEITDYSDKNGNCNRYNEYCSILTPITKEELHYMKRKFSNKILKNIIKDIQYNEQVSVLYPFTTKEKGCLIYETYFM